jgi:uncharacterized protein (DUF2147 family)
MQLNTIVRRAAAFGLFVLCASAARAADSPLGVWIDHTGRGAVEIKDCGEGALCGHVVWLQDQANIKGCGLQILGDVKPSGDGEWDNGWIYDPDKRSKFDVALTPVGPDKLKVLGYAGVKFLSKTMMWQRAVGELQMCDAAAGAAARAETAPKSSGAEAKAAPPPPDEEASAEPPQATEAEEPAPDSKVTAAKPDAKTADAPPVDGGDKKPAKEASSNHKWDCKLEVPYVTITFPCKDE